MFVHVPRGQAIEQPIHVLNIATDLDTGASDDTPPMANPRNIIIADAQAQVTLIEHYVSLTEQRYFNNAVTQLTVGDAGIVHHYLIEQESPAAQQLSSLIIDQGKDSDVHSHTVLLGGDWVAQQHLSAHRRRRLPLSDQRPLPGAPRPAHGQPHAHRHNAAHGDSRQFYKGVLQDQAHTVFSGRIYVAAGAQKTDAKQHNQALLLSRDANAIGKPQLEIHADDVKCTHGATSGEIDENAIFYLTARGIDKETARGLMIYAFAAESFERMNLEPVRTTAHPRTAQLAAQRRPPQSDPVSTGLQ